MPASFSGDGGSGFVESTAREHIGEEVKWIKSDVDADSVQASVKGSLPKSLTVEDAVQIALFNNRGLQVMYGELGIAEADVVQADTCRTTLSLAPTGIEMEVDAQSRSE